MALRDALTEAERALQALLAEAEARAAGDAEAGDGAAANYAMRRVDAMAAALQRARRLLTPSGAAGLAMLPPEVQHRILQLLPVDEALRAAAVCRAWRVAVANAPPSTWTHLDLSSNSGISRPVTGAFLRSAAAHAAAAGGLRSLDVSGRGCADVSYAELLEVVSAHAATLRHLRRVASFDERYDADFCSVEMPFEEVRGLLCAAPCLQSAYLCVTAVLSAGEVLPLLQRNSRRNAFAPLQLAGLNVAGSASTAAQAYAMFNAIAAYGSPLPYLEMDGVQLGSPEVLSSSLINACFAGRVSILQMAVCHGLQRALAAAPDALARLISSPTLACFYLGQYAESEPPLLSMAVMTDLAPALRANRTLTTVSLTSAKLFKEDTAVGVSLLGALTGHPTVCTIDLASNLFHSTYTYNGDETTRVAHRAALGGALGALVAAVSPALTHLVVRENHLGDAGMRPFFEALRGNTHLRELDCTGNYPGAAAADVLLASVSHGALGLRELRVAEYGKRKTLSTAVLKQAETFVEALIGESPSLVRRGMVTPGVFVLPNHQLRRRWARSG